MSGRGTRLACCADAGDYVCRAALAAPTEDEIFQVVRGWGSGGMITISFRGRDVDVHAIDWRIVKTQGEILAEELMRK